MHSYVLKEWETNNLMRIFSGNTLTDLRLEDYISHVCLLSNTPPWNEHVSNMHTNTSFWMYIIIHSVTSTVLKYFLIIIINERQSKRQFARYVRLNYQDNIYSKQIYILHKIERLTIANCWIVKKPIK